MSASACATRGSRPGARPSRSDRPNVVIIFTDDQGYGDVGCYGAQGFQTPHLDRMAAQGMRFTDFYSASPVCTPSRAALLTGCYPPRIGLQHVLSPESDIGISDTEVTLAELVKSQGYATACFGKWHLGHQPQFLPTRHGFDEYFGLPYSNDMWPYTTWYEWPDLPLIEGDQVVKYNPDQANLTTWYTEHAVRFIERHKDQPFLLYVPHSMPHVPLYVSDKFKGKSDAGLYGDVIMEIDWSVGQILDALARCAIDDRTLVIFTSDNGPWLSYGDHGGSAGTLREGKFTTFEGGVRMPCIMRWPDGIPAGSVCREPAMTIDILPTVAEMVSANLPNHPIDGNSFLPLIKDEKNACSPHEALCFFAGESGEELQAVRSGSWKLDFPCTYPSLAGKPGGTNGMEVEYTDVDVPMALYDLQNDIGEEHNVADEHPDVVEHLTELAARFDRDLKRNRRPPGRIL